MSAELYTPVISHTKINILFSDKQCITLFPIIFHNISRIQLELYLSIPAASAFPVLTYLPMFLTFRLKKLMKPVCLLLYAGPGFRYGPFFMIVKYADVKIKYRLRSIRNVRSDRVGNTKS
jgi:hypothetical protein